MKLLGKETDTKTTKGSKYGWLTGILYLAPAEESVAHGGFNTCSFASEACKNGCLYNAGLASVYPKIKQARIRKTIELKTDRQAFIAQLRKDIESLTREAKRRKMRPCVRINGTSDLPWLAMQLASEYPSIQFYDYTKIPKPYTRTLPNYHLTFSHSGTNLDACIDALQHGVNVAVVFDTRKGHALPETWQGYKVIDGDITDLRFTDAKQVVIGLRAKGIARKQTNSFIQIGTLPSMRLAHVIA